VRNDDGYEVAFAGRDKLAQKVTYSDGRKSKTILGEPGVLARTEHKRKWGLHFAFGDRYLARWDDGSEMSPEERETLRNRIHASLEYMGVPHAVDWV
jgi:hypothetical protein